ncbi:hypothetical protein GF359_10680 [candidate division WOR-3 bacterium]|uniref:Uncharacterized protein n=1 Tax=candidate division WOR-3 bacterium TaxID=2052148 RepID=A0A9D5QE23_UNCW3|nr:hypothetical protein [candidate division WOR-3 bacterium]
MAVCYANCQTYAEGKIRLGGFMWSFVSLVLTLSFFCKAEAQTDALLETLTQQNPSLYGSIGLVAVNTSGQLWLVGKWGSEDEHSKVYATLICRKSKVDLDKMMIHESEGGYSAHFWLRLRRRGFQDIQGGLGFYRSCPYL